ncbi:MAG: choice-of-anchor tandem repeat GloVer-containing protein [Candidatus Sulfotelmatobacter sp.]|jgi:uncharacterized repeat protein (TIGR03803 family)
MKPLLGFLASLAMAISLPAQTSPPPVSQLFAFSCSANFSSCPEGMDPTLSPIQLADGNFYGVTWWAGKGSSNNGGTVWKATPSGQVTALYTFDFNASGKFPNGENPVIGFAAGTDGNLYGITESGGSANAGVMYKLTPSGSFELLHNFCTLSGCPDTPAPIILGKDGNFYGAQFQTLFQLTPQGDWSQVYSLSSAVGSFSGQLIQGSDGNFYGTGRSASELCGSFLFRLTPSGQFTVLYTFPEFEETTSNLIEASDGNFYGGSTAGIFRLTPSGGFKIIHQMTQAQGPSPSRLLQASDGNLWGLSVDGGTAPNRPGTLFTLTTAGKFLSSEEFNCAKDGCNPLGMVEGSDGNFYGNAITGGSASGRSPLGTFFKVEAGLTPPQ